MPATSGAPAQIRSHSGLRGIAALLVVMYHAHFGAAYLLPFEQATAIFQRSYLMVDLFFILSGFIISHVNRADRRHGYARGEVGDFLARRLIRIYPLLLFTLATLVLFRLAAAALAIHSAETGWDRRSLVLLAAQFLMLNAWLPNNDGWNTASWSISAEMAAYLLFPLVVSLRARARMAARLLIILGALAFYGIVAAGSASLDIIAGTAPLRCLAGFALGMLIYDARYRFAALPAALLAAMQIAAAAAILSLLAIPSNDVLIVAPFALLVASSWTDRGLAGPLLGNRLMLWLGDRSYSVYLNHLIVKAMLLVPWGFVARRTAPDPMLERAGFLLVYLASVLLVSHLTYRLIEIPARRWLTRRWLHHPATPIAASAPAP